MRKLSIVTACFCVLSVGTLAAAAQSRPIILKDNFNAYTFGSVVGQGGWVNYGNGQSFMVSNDLPYRKGKELHNIALGDSEISKFGTAQATGVQSILIRTDNRAAWGSYTDGNVQVRMSKGQSFASSIFAAVSFKQDGHVAYYDPIADAYKNFAIYQDNKWTEVDFEWRASDRTVRYRVGNSAWTNWLTFNNAEEFTNFDNIGLGFALPSGAGGVYFDELQ